MGLGKTIQAIEAMNQLGDVKSGLIICPASVKYNWMRELNSWLKCDRTIQIIHSGKDIVKKDTHIVIVNYDLVIRDFIHRQLIKRNYDVAIIDEAHKLKNMDAQRTQAVLGKRAVLRNAYYKFALSGTPILNKPFEFFPILKTMAAPNIRPYDSEMRFGLRFCKGRETDTGWKFDGAENIPELRDRLKGFMLRRTKNEVLQDLPPYREQYLYLDYSPEVDDLPIATARRVVSESKLPGVKAHIMDVLDNVDKVVVFAHHREIIESLQRDLQFDYNPVILYGGMSAEQKQKSLDEFISNPDCRLLIGQTHTAGQGIDGLQKVCSHIIFAELDWSPGVMDQARDRLIRYGQKNPVLIQYILSHSSLENAIEDTLMKKRKVINQLLNERKNPMTLESSLERIAVALETIAANGGLSGTGDGEVTTEKPKKATGKKTPIKEEKEVNTDDDIFSDTPAPKQTNPQYTLDDVRVAANKFVSSNNDIDGNKSKARSIISKIGGVEKINDLTPDKFAPVIKALEDASL